MTVNDRIDAGWTRICDIYKRAGDREYGEAVSELTHAIQTALLAEESEASDSLVVACLLHDIGHLLHDAGEDIADKNVDMKHEVLGASFLEKWFLPRVTCPVALHVDAKRYLATRAESYLHQLSPASVKSFWLQGGYMTEEELKNFSAGDYYQDAIKLRLFDELAKDPEKKIPRLSNFEAVVKRELAAKFQS